MTEAYARLALVLPLLLLGLGALLYAAKRGLIRLPGATLGTPPLKLVQVLTLGPSSKLAVVDFAGTQLLLGIARNGIALLSAPSPPGAAGERGGPGWGLALAASTELGGSPPPQPSPLSASRGGRGQQP